MKKILIFTAVIMLFSTGSFAQIVGGTTGVLTWSLDLNDSTLTISDSGEMLNYNYSDSLAPWHTHRANIINVVIGDSITNIGNYAFYQCNKLVSVNIPNSVTSIGTAAFWECRNLASAIIPNDVTNLEGYVFAFCDSLASVNIPNKITNIGDWTFYCCQNLESIIIPDKVTSIGDYAFYQCTNLTSINIPNEVISIGSHVFNQCGKLTSINIPDKVVSLGNFVFFQCNGLTSVYIPHSVASMGIYVFGECRNLESIDVDENNAVFSSEDGILFNKSKTTVIQYPINKLGTSYSIPNSVTIIGTSSFRYSNLVTVNIPNSVIYICDFAFGYCYSLNSVTIGKNVDSVSYGVFNECIAIKHIYSLNEIPPITCTGTFYLIDTNTCILHVPIGCKSKYAEAFGWKSFINIEEDAIWIEKSQNYEVTKLRVYPNPTTGQLIIDNGQLTTENVEIYNAVGQKQKIIDNYQLPIVNSIDVSHLASGLYVLKIRNKTVKFLKE